MLYLKGHRQRLVAPPVWRQHGAQEVGAVRADQLPGVVRQHVRYIPGVRSRPERARVGHGPVALSDLAAGEGRGGRCKPSGRHVVYGKNHHNNWESSPKADVAGSEERTLGVTNAAFFSRFSVMTDWPQPSPVVERRADGRRGRRTAVAGWDHTPKKRVFSKIWRMPGDCGRPCETNHPENMGCFLFTQQTWKPGALQRLSRGGAVNWPIDTSMCRFAWLQNTMWLLRAHWQVC